MAFSTFSGPVVSTNGFITDKIVHLGDTDTAIRFPANDTFTVETAGAERLRIDSSGNLLVGTTSGNPAGGTGTGVQLNGSSGQVNASRSGGASGVFNRTTSDGDIVQFRKDGAPVGSIGVGTSDLLIGKADIEDCFLRFGTGGAAITLCDSTGLNTNDGLVDLGQSNYRFKDLYLSGGVYLGGTGAANLLDDYEEGTWTPTLVGHTTAGSYTITPASSSATYVKVGKIVHVAARMTITVNSAGTGLARFGGLPFTSSGNTRGMGPVSTSNVSLPASTLFAVSSLWTANTTDFSLSCTRDNAGISTLDVSGISSGDAIDFRMTYETT